MHPEQTKVYVVVTDASPRDLEQYFILNGKFVGKQDSNSHGEYELGDQIKISPDGKYLFNDLGNVFKGDLSYALKPEVPFNDLAFDLDQNRFFSGIENVIFEHDYSTFEIYNYYVLNGEAIKTFYKDGKMYILSLMTVGSTGLQKFTLESITLMGY
jgi:hypothetical protein